jgi:hypothetical protein
MAQSTLRAESEDCYQEFIYKSPEEGERPRERLSKECRRTHQVNVQAIGREASRGDGAINSAVSDSASLGRFLRKPRV